MWEIAGTIVVFSLLPDFHLGALKSGIRIESRCVYISIHTAVAIDFQIGRVRLTGRWTDNWVSKHIPPFHLALLRKIVVIESKIGPPNGTLKGFCFVVHLTIENGPKKKTSSSCFLVQKKKRIWKWWKKIFVSDFNIYPSI